MLAEAGRVFSRLGFRFSDSGMTVLGVEALSLMSCHILRAALVLLHPLCLMSLPLSQNKSKSTVCQSLPALHGLGDQ